MQQCTIMPCVREILLNLTLPNEGPQGPQGPPNAVMMHPGMTRPPMPGPPHMAPQMGGPPMRPGNLSRGIANWSGAARSVVQGPKQSL